jgi:cytochrome c peroxidase
MKKRILGMAMPTVAVYSILALAEPLGLPPVPTPADNPQTPEKIALGEKLFHDTRFSSTSQVSCATCHEPGRAFTDSPLKTSRGIRGLTGTRNSPTVFNAAYAPALFWDGRSPSLEDQALHPFLNPVEMGLPSHDPILAVVRSDPEYARSFQQVFGKTGETIGIKEVTQAIASFERTVLAGDLPFDRWYFRGEQSALGPIAVRGFQVFTGQGRCVSCHVIEQNQALFTDQRFHNIGVGINALQAEVPRLAGQFLEAKAKGAQLDLAVLTDPNSSELGRFAVTNQFDELGAFKTPTLRNIALTAPYMHDGSLKTLAEVIEHYNNGGAVDSKVKVNPYLSGGIRPLNLSPGQKADLAAFMETLTSPQAAQPTKAGGPKRRKSP